MPGELVEDGMVLMEDSVGSAEEGVFPQPVIIVELVFAGKGAEFLVGAAAERFGALLANHDRYGCISSAGGRIEGDEDKLFGND